MGAIEASRLADLDWLRQRYQMPPSDAGPDPKALVSIAQNLRAEPESQRSLWEQFLLWLRHLFDRRDPQAPGWLSRLMAALQHTPHWVGQAIVYSGLAAILVLLVVIIRREVIIALADVRHAKKTVRSTVAPAHADSTPVSWRDVERAPLRERPVWLLRLLVQTLVAEGRLQGERSLTHGELIARAQFPDDTQRQRFGRIARLAEQRRYAGEAVLSGERSDLEIEGAVAEARELYVQLAAASGSAAS